MYVPEHPGTCTDDPAAIEQVDELWDLVLIYEETVQALDLGEGAVIVGQSIGGMLAAELAASYQALFSKLVGTGRALAGGCSAARVAELSAG